MKLSRTRLVWIVGGLLILVAAAAALRPGEVPADFTTVTRGPLRVTIDEEGETRVKHPFVVSAPVPGRMRRIELEPGDRVKANETVLARFEPSDPVPLDIRTRTELEARVSAARANLERVRAERERTRRELEFAQSELGRTRELAAAGVTARDRLEAAENQVRTLDEALKAGTFAVTTAESELAAAQAGLLQAQGGRRADRAPSIDLRAPVDGIVLRRFRESEAVVPAGEPLLEIGRLSDLEIVSDLLSTDAAQVRAGQRVLVEQWGGDEAIEGRVRLVEPAGFMKISALGVEEQRVNVVIDFAGERPQALGSGYRVEVRIIVWEREIVVKVPTSSLFRDEDEWAVYRVEQGRAARRRVEIGRRTGLEAEVLSGLAEGDTIIAYPSDQITDGVRVTSR